jgi:hypothetical protein
VLLWGPSLADNAMKEKLAAIQQQRIPLRALRILSLSVGMQ